MSGLLARRAARSTVGLVLVCASLTLGGSALAAGLGPTLDFSGQVRDTLGNVLDGVEVLILAPAPAVVPLAAVRSDVGGRFAIVGLGPGSYRVAALKGGYLTWIGGIDTRLQTWLDVVLRPASTLEDPDSRPLPRDASWALRVPRRIVWRESGARELFDTTAPQPGQAASSGLLGDGLNVQVEQRVAVGAPSAGAVSAASELQGSETRLRMAGVLGERGTLRLDGRHESLGSSWSGSQRDGSAKRDDSAVRVDFSYDPAPDSQLAVRAFYNQRELEWNFAGQDGADALEQDRQSWGWASEWVQQLGATSSVSVNMQYEDHALVASRHGAPWNDDPQLGRFDRGVGPNRLAQRAVAAGGSFQSLAADGHQLEIGFRASLLDTPLTTTGVWFPTGADPALTDARWSVRLNAQDTWRIAGPLAVTGGFGVRRAGTTGQTTVVVPRVGGSWTDGRVVARATLSYHVVTEWSELANRSVPTLAPSLRAGLPVADRPNDRVGYDVEVELPIGGGVRLRGGARYEPVQFEPTSADAEPLQLLGAPPYYSDGNARVGATRIALIHEREGTRVYLELEQGYAEGLVAAAVPELSFQLLFPGALSYSEGRWGVYVIPSGTDVRLQYRRAVETLPGDVELTELRLLELSVMQDLLRLRSLGNWRFLMAVRLGGQTFDQEDDVRAAQNLIAAESFSRGVSAGLSVTF